jgi:hypothetical protein
MSRLVLSLLSLAAVHGFAPAKTPFALGRAGVRYAGVGDDEIFAAASACLDEECSVDTARTPASAARRRTPTSRGRGPPRADARPSIARALTGTNAQVDVLLAALRTREQELATTGVGAPRARVARRAHRRRRSRAASSTTSSWKRSQTCE